MHAYGVDVGNVVKFLTTFAILDIKFITSKVSKLINEKKFFISVSKIRFLKIAIGDTMIVNRNKNRCHHALREK